MTWLLPRVHKSIDWNIEGINRLVDRPAGVGPMDIRQLVKEVFAICLARAATHGNCCAIGPWRIILIETSLRPLRLHVLFPLDPFGLIKTFKALLDSIASDYLIIVTTDTDENHEWHNEAVHRLPFNMLMLLLLMRLCCAIINTNIGTGARRWLQCG